MKFCATSGKNKGLCVTHREQSMSEHENSSAKISLLYMGWIVAAFSLGTWFGHFGLPLPFNKIPSQRAKEVETVRPIESIRQKKTPKKSRKSPGLTPPSAAQGEDSRAQSASSAKDTAPSEESHTIQPQVDLNRRVTKHRV